MRVAGRRSMNTSVDEMFNGVKSGLNKAFCIGCRRERSAPQGEALLRDFINPLYGRTRRKALEMLNAREMVHLPYWEQA